MMTTKKLITSDDPKGLDASAKWRGVYNKTKLTDGADGSAQRLNESREFWKELGELIVKHSTTNQFANEVASSSYTYPSEYKGSKPIDEQIRTVASLFGLDWTEAMEFAKNLPTLPEGAEGWFAIPKVSAVGKKFFPAITDPAQQYCEVVKLVHTKLAESRSFYNYRDGEIVPSKLRQHSRTVDFLEHLEAEQAGDILILAVQYGMKHRGESVRRARETFAGNEFGLTSFVLGCMALVHPERFVRWEELDTDCAGDEFSPVADGVFSRAPFFYFGNDRLRFGAYGVSDAFGYFGAASGFVPQLYFDV
ncbi:MAG: hypothetical protein NTV03_01380 [Candidatus Nomurabacteria bacterium]|nr:hypothetical protein [Candidatus Nomurabacteria bacterium]